MEAVHTSEMSVCFETTQCYIPEGSNLHAVKPVNPKLCNSKFHYISNFILNLRPKDEKLIQIDLAISKTLIIHNLKENLPCSDNFYTILPI
jgi:hypothetical protein